MAEWHVTPDYIVNNWTNELLTLMCEKLTERKQRIIEARSGKVSEGELFAKAGSLIKVVKDGD